MTNPKTDPDAWVGVTEVGELLGGITPQHAWYFTQREGFPAPVRELRNGRLWDRAEVLDWYAKWRETPHGRAALGRRAGARA